MSIINDALKKTQSRFEHRKQLSPAEYKKSEKKSFWHQAAVTLVILGFLGCSFIFYSLSTGKNLIEILKGKRTQPEKFDSLKASSQTKKTSEQKPPPPATEKTERLILNGIINMGDDDFALINNEIYRQGDRVNGKEIVKILKDRVELFSDGETIILKTK